MKKKILLVSAVILISVGLLSVSKIVQNKYLNKDIVTTQQQEKEPVKEEIDVVENNVQEDAVKEEVSKEEVKPTSKEQETKVVAENKTVTEKETTGTESSSTKNVVVEKKEEVVIKEAVPVKAPEPKKQPNFIIKDDISGKTILSINVNIENKTVAQVTFQALDNKGISYRTSGRGEAIYFTMINNLKARDQGPLSGWCYFVNGAKPGVSCGAYKLKSGDVVQWKYLEDGVNN